MLKKLTKKQTVLMYEIRDNWVNKAYNPIQKGNVIIRKGINDLYTLCGLKKPKNIIIVDSPLGLCLLNNTIKNKKSVGYSVGDSMWVSVRVPVEVSVRVSVEVSVRDSVRGSVWDSVEVSVEGSVRESVREFVRDSVEDSVGDWSSYVNYSDYGWCSFYHYFTQIGVLENDKFTKFLEILDSGIYEWIGYENLAIVCRLPKPLKWITKKNNRVLHSIEGCAIEWNDGYGQYYIEGVSFNTTEGVELFKKISSNILTVKEAMLIKNQEQRTIALKYIGRDQVVENSDDIKIIKT